MIIVDSVYPALQTAEPDGNIAICPDPLKNYNLL